MDIKIGENLKTLRTKYKYTLEDVADVIGVSRQSVSKWEKCETYPDIENCLKLSILFRTTIDDLVKSDTEPYMEKTADKKYVCDTAVVGCNGEIKLPLKALEMFEIEQGDTIIVLCDSTRGMALVKTKEEYNA